MLLSELPRANGIKFNDLILKPRGIEAIVSRSCRLVLLESNTDRTLPLGRTGTCTLLKNRQRRFVVMTRHQLGLQPNVAPDLDVLETVRVASGQGQLRNIPLGNCIFETSNSDQEFHDLLFFEVSGDWIGANLDAPYFVSVNGFNSGKRHLSRVFGCPVLPVVMGEYLENFGSETEARIHIKTSFAACQFDEDFQSTTPYYRHYLGGPEQYPADGISGGAMFSVVDGYDGYEMVLDGIVVRAGNGHVYVVDADYIELVLRQ